MRRQAYFQHLYSTISCVSHKTTLTERDFETLESLCLELLMNGARAADFTFVYRNAAPRTRPHVEAYRNLRRHAMQQSIRAKDVSEIKKIFAAVHEDVQPIVIEHWLGLARTRKDFMEAYTVVQKRGTSNEVMLRRKFISAGRAAGIALVFPPLPKII